MTNEQLRMQFIGGIITESEYKAKIEENKSPKSKKSLNENIVSIGAINNPFPKHKKSDYELAFEHFTKGGLNEEEGNPFKMGSNINTIEELEQALNLQAPIYSYHEALALPPHRAWNGLILTTILTHILII